MYVRKVDIMFIFRLIVLFWVTARRVLHDLALKKHISVECIAEKIVISTYMIYCCSS